MIATATITTIELIKITFVLLKPPVSDAGSVVRISSVVVVEIAGTNLVVGFEVATTGGGISLVVVEVEVVAVVVVVVAVVVVSMGVVSGGGGGMYGVIRSKIYGIFDVNELYI